MYWSFIFIIVNSHVINTITLLTISQHSANHIISHPTSFHLQQLSKHHSQYSSKKQYNQWKVAYTLNTPKCPQNNQKKRNKYSTEEKCSKTKGTRFLITILPHWNHKGQHVHAHLFMHTVCECVCMCTCLCPYINAWMYVWMHALTAYVYRWIVE